MRARSHRRHYGHQLCGARQLKPQDFKFRAYEAADLPACMILFDANCPAYFAPNERAEFETFLGLKPAGYLLVRKAVKK